jgi:hypothetical protein
MLTIEQILAADDRKVEEVQVPEWGGSVCVRHLSGLEAVDLYVQLKGIAGTETEKAAARMVASLSAFLCDTEGKQLASIEQAKLLIGKSAVAVNRIVAKGHAINATDDAKVADGAKNSEPSRADSSPSV